MATYIRLTDYKSSDEKEKGFFEPENRYEAKQSDFAKIPGSPITYWMTDNIRKKFIDYPSIDNLMTTRAGMCTGDNEFFLKFWQEVSFDKIGFFKSSFEEVISSNKKWFQFNKGGEYFRWYGNNDIFIKFNKENIDLLSKSCNKLASKELYFKEGITWNAVSSSNFGVRLHEKGSIVSNAAMVAFPEKNFNYIFAFFNTKIVKKMVEFLSPTINFNVGDISKVPVIIPQQESTKQQIDTLTQECIDISKEDWDSRETSWNFTKNELLKHLVPKGTLCEKSDSKLETAYNNYCSYWKEKFYKLHSNEEELNRLFIDIYELQDEITPDVDLKDITILKQESFINDSGELEFDSSEIMKQFISYAVGVMFGRYSLNSDGLIVANLNQDYPKDTTFEIDDDNVIPVLEDDYFSDDIASRIINFVKTTFGSESLSTNIAFIEKCLGKTIRAYMVKDFYEDHIRRYKKRPIYWMVTSPKKGFMSLSYMHRYKSDLFALVQNNYLREYIAKLEGTYDLQ